jgi:hypothetical protein
MGAIGIVARPLSPRRALIVGALISGAGMVLLILAVSLRDLVIYLLATAAAGGAYSLLFVGGLQVISVVAPERHRGGILAALYLLSYLSMGALALALGALATARGLSCPGVERKLHAADSPSHQQRVGSRHRRGAYPCRHRLW